MIKTVDCKWNFVIWQLAKPIICISLSQNHNKILVVSLNDHGNDNCGHFILVTFMYIIIYLIYQFIMCKYRFKCITLIRRIPNRSTLVPLSDGFFLLFIRISIYMYMYNQFRKIYAARAFSFQIRFFNFFSYYFSFKWVWAMCMAMNYGETRNIFSNL